MDQLLVLDLPDPVGLVLPALPCPVCGETVEPDPGYPESCPHCGFAPP